MSGKSGKPRGKPFGPNNNANPSGRPKVAHEFKEKARKAADEHVIKAWISEVETRGEHWVKCSEFLAAYGYGKPMQPTESKVDVVHHSVREMTSAQLDARIAELEGQNVEH